MVRLGSSSSGRSRPDLPRRTTPTIARTNLSTSWEARSPSSSRASGGASGAFVFGPREIPHGFKVVGDQPAQMLLQDTPGGFEQFVIELGQPLSDPIAPPNIPLLIETAARYGI